MSEFPRMELPAGYVEATGDNGIKIVSTIRDPSELRLTVRADLVESNLAKVSFGLERSDGSGRDDEMGYVMCRLTPDKKAGAFYLATKGPGDQQSKERFYIDHGAAIFRVPVFAPNLGGVGGGLPLAIALRSRANGKFVCAEGIPQRPLLANRDGIGEWEIFDVVPV